MIGLIIGVIWTLVSVANDYDMSPVIQQISFYLWWWYIVTSILLFFFIPSVKDPQVEEMYVSLNPVLRAILIPGQLFSAIMFNYIVSRILIFVGMHFIHIASLGETLFMKKLIVGACLTLLGALVGSAVAIIPSVTAKVRKRYQT